MKGAARGLQDRKREGWGIRGKIKWRLPGVNTRDVSTGQGEMIGKFKMATGDVISIRGQFLEYTYIPRGIERELVRGKLSGLLEEDQWPFILIYRLFLVLPT